MSSTTSDLDPTRLSLLLRIKNPEDQKSWYEFAGIYSRLIQSMAGRSGLTEHEANEVVQDTLISVSKAMPGFHYDPGKGSFKSWLFSITKRRIADVYRKRRQSARHQQLPETGEGIQAIEEKRWNPEESPMEKAWDEEYQKRLLEIAIQNVKGRIDPFHYQIFDCYVNKNWKVKDVVQFLQVSHARVYLVKYRIRRLIANEVSRLEKELI